MNAPTGGARWVTLPGLMLALTFVTGVVDAVGYLRLDQVFAGNMTGNVVILGMAAAGGPRLPVLGPALALVSFLAGAALAGRVLRGAVRPGWNRRCTALLAGGAAVLGASALALTVLGTDAHGTRAAAASALALAMGAQAATARHLAVRDVTTVVVTSTLTGLAADSRLGAARPQGSLRRLSAVVSIVLGAVAGALLCRVDEGAAVAVAALVVAVVTALGPLTARARSTAPAAGPARTTPSSSSADARTASAPAGTSPAPSVADARTAFPAGARADTPRPGRRDDGSLRTAGSRPARQQRTGRP
ncbi:DUF1275 family protein [Streptomyces sp. MAD19A]|uniref:YoaK family protein n=1 Tax=Streptomyces sp. MAD19A TaxID=3242896 RepID=UPI0035298A90